MITTQNGEFKLELCHIYNASKDRVFSSLDQPYYGGG